MATAKQAGVNPRDLFKAMSQSEEDPIRRLIGENPGGGTGSSVEVCEEEKKSGDEEEDIYDNIHVLHMRDCRIKVKPLKWVHVMTKSMLESTVFG